MDYEGLTAAVEGLNTTKADEKDCEWQLFVGGQWLRIDNDHIIETHYCHPGAKAITINTSNGKVFIDFDKLQTLDSTVKVQRLSFLPPGQTEDIGWYYRDDQLWREYGSQSSSRLSSSISSRDVEQQFTLNCQGSFSFTVGSTTYNLDFPTMTQTNSTTGMRRKVRRRPKFMPKKKSSRSSSIRFTSARTAPAPSKLTSGGYKWEFMADEGVWMEYKAYICAFDSNAMETQYQLNPQGQLQFKINKFTYTLDFAGMYQVNNKIGTKRAVRRTAVDASQQNTNSGTPRWQFLDIGGIWRDYIIGPQQSSVSSQDIELQYQQNPSGIMKFHTSQFHYELDFSAMTQKNLSTYTTRTVRRLNQ